jgi:hypothetical protein
MGSTGLSWRSRSPGRPGAALPRDSSLSDWRAVEPRVASHGRNGGLSRWRHLWGYRDPPDRPVWPRVRRETAGDAVHATCRCRCRSSRPARRLHWSGHDARADHRDAGAKRGDGLDIENRAAASSIGATPTGGHHHCRGNLHRDLRGQHGRRHRWGQWDQRDRCGDRRRDGARECCTRYGRIGSVLGHEAGHLSERAGPRCPGRQQ